MILLDLSQVSISTLFAHIGPHTNIAIEEDMLRHMSLNMIRAIYMKFKNEYGELVIACDDKHYWRKDLFPYYKANRKKTREESELDWNSIFVSLHKIRDEIKANLPYKVIHVPTAEADDIIAVMANKTAAINHPTLIISGDKDYQQLQINDCVKQYNPIMKKFIVCASPRMFLKEHIIRGDTGDGIPNFLSSDNCLVIGEKQKSITKKKLAEWLKYDNPSDFCNEQMLRNYERNRMLIDFNHIPEDIKNETIRQYMDNDVGQRKNLLNYFMEHRLRNLMENAGDF